ncbi:unnamed protein product, partial [Closterium sp. NIES-53]
MCAYHKRCIYYFVCEASFYGLSRRENLERAEQLLLKGKRTEARECFQKAVDITPAIAHQLIK